MTGKNEENGAIEIRSGNPASRNAIAIAVIAIALIGFIGFFMKSETYAKTVNEVITSGDELAGKSVRVEGKILEDISFSDDRSTLYFQLEDMNQPQGYLNIEYSGPPPDGFQEGYTAIVTGRVEGSSKVKAYQLMCKCPSRYEAMGSEAPEDELNEHLEMHEDKASEYSGKSGGGS